MAAVLTRRDEDELSSIESVGGADPGAAASPALGGTAGDSGASQTDVGQIIDLNQGVDYDPLLDTIRSQGQAARGAISGAQTDFTNALGSAPVFDGEEQGILDQVLAGSRGLGEGSSLLDTDYTGPEGINQSRYAQPVSLYGERARMTQGLEGIDSLLGLLNPALSPGERRYDALVLSGNPNFRSEASGLVNDANEVAALGGQAATDASSAVGQRRNQIGEFNTAGRGYVQGQRDAINTAISGQMQAAQTDDDQLRTLLEQIRGGSANLSQVGDEDLAFSRSIYGTPQTFTSSYGANIFNRSVDPRAYLNYMLGDPITRDTAATAGQATQFNNAQALLGFMDRLNPMSRTGARLSFDQAAMLAAITQAQQGLAAADSAEAARLAALLAAQQRPTGTPGNPYGGGGGDGDGGATGGAAGSGESGSGVGNGSDGGVGTGAGSDAAGGGAGSSGTGDGASWAKGGSVTKDRLLDIDPPGADDGFGALDDGEFVTRASSVNATGVGNMHGLNKLDRESPGDQRMVRAALSEALRRARSR